MPIQRFEPFPGSPEGRGPRRVFGYFLHAAKSNVKTPLGTFFGGGAWGTPQKVTQKTVSFLAFRESKSLFPGFPETMARPPAALYGQPGAYPYSIVT